MAHKSEKQRVMPSMEKLLKVGQHAVAKGSSDIMSTQREARGATPMALVGHLIDHPEKIDVPAKVVQRDNFGKEGGGRQSAIDPDVTHWPEQYTSWDKVPKPWLWAFIQKKYLNTTTTEDISQITLVDREAIRKVILRCTNIRWQAHLDPALRDKSVMIRFLHKQFDAQGKIWPALVQHIDWG